MLQLNVIAMRHAPSVVTLTDNARYLPKSILTRSRNNKSANSAWLSGIFTQQNQHLFRVRIPDNAVSLCSKPFPGTREVGLCHGTRPSLAEH
jgi:hypothetical protein